MGGLVTVEIKTRREPFGKHGSLRVLTGKRRAFHKRIFFLLFKSFAPLTISKTPEATPVTRMQMPMARLDAPEKPIVLYTFSFIEKPPHIIV